MSLIHESVIANRNTKVIKLIGNFTQINYKNISNSLEKEILDPEFEYIIIDLKEIGLLTGFSIMQLSMFKRKKKRKLVLLNPIVRVKAILEDEKYNDMFDIFYDLDSAVKFFNQKYEVNTDEVKKSKKVFGIHNYLKYHFMINEKIFRINNPLPQTSKYKSRKQSKPTTNDYDPIFVIVTESAVHGKVLTGVFEEHEYKAEVYSIKEVDRIFKTKKVVVNWFFFDDSLDNLNNNEVFILLEKIKNHELLNSLVAAPIIILRGQIKYEESELQKLKGFGGTVLNYRLVDNKKTMYEECINLLKNREKLEVYLTPNILFRIKGKNLVLRFMTNINDEDLKKLTSFVTDPEILELKHKIFLLNVELKTYKKLPDYIARLLINLYHNFDRKVLIYISKSNQEIIDRLKKVYPSYRICVI